MGVDLGTKTIGLAISDVERRLSTPFETIQRVKFGDRCGAKDVCDRSTRSSAAAFVIGLPLNMDGTEGPRAQSTRSVRSQLRGADGSAVPSCSGTSVFRPPPSRAPSLNRMRRAPEKRAAVVDRMVAAYILQGALDRLRRHRGRSLIDDLCNLRLKH